MKLRLGVIIGILVGLVILMLATGEASIGILAAVLVILFLAGFFINRKAAAGIEITTKVDENSGRCDDIVVLMTVKNKSIFPIFKGRVFLRVRNKNFNFAEHEMLSFSVMGKQERVVRYRVKSEYCGMYEILINEVRCYDVWGFTFRSVCKDLEFTACMYPNFQMIQKVSQILKINYEKERKFSGQKNTNLSEIRQYREFIAGDSLKHVNWKLSNKFDDLLVREFDTPIDNQIIIVLDIKKGDEVYQNLAYTVLFSISMTYLEYGIFHQLGWVSEAGFATKHIENEVMLFREMKTLFSTEARIDTGVFDLMKKNGHPEKYAKIIYIANNLTKGTAQKLSIYNNIDLITVDGKHFDIDNIDEDLRRLVV